MSARTFLRPLQPILRNAPPCAPKGQQKGRRFRDACGYPRAGFSSKGHGNVHKKAAGAAIPVTTGIRTIVGIKWVRLLYDGHPKSDGRFADYHHKMYLGVIVHTP